MGREIKFRIAADGSSARSEYAGVEQAGRKTYDSLSSMAAATMAAEKQNETQIRAVGDAVKTAADSWAVFDIAAKASTDRQAANLARLAQIAKETASSDVAQNNFNAFMGVGQAPTSAKASAAFFQEQIAAADAATAAIAGVVAESREAEAVLAQMGNANLGRALSDAAAKAADLEARAASLRAAIDPLTAAEQRYSAELARNKELADANKISATELAAANDLAKKRFDATRLALGQLGDDGRLAGYQITNLSYQLNDVVTQLASGSNPLTVLVQQGLQIRQIFGNDISAGGILSGLLQGLKAFVPVTAAVYGGLLAIAGGIVYAYASYQSGVRELNASLAGKGAASGASANQMEQIAEAANASSKITVGAARDIEEAFAKTGKIGVDNFQQLIDITKKYSRESGQDLDKARDELAGAFGGQDLLQGIDALDQKLGFLDDKTREHIRSLIDMNDREGALKFTLNAMNPALDESARHVSGIAAAWDSVKAAVSGAITYIGRAIAGAGEDAQIKFLTQYIKDLQDKKIVPLDGRTTEQAIADAESKLQALQKQADAVSKRADDQRARDASKLSAATAVNLEPNEVLLRNLQKQQADLNASLTTPGAQAKMTADDLALVKDRYDAVTRAITSLRDEHGKLITAEDVTIQKEQIAAKLAATPNDAAHADIRQKLLEQQKSLDLTGKVVTAAQAEKEVQLAGAKAYGEASQHIDAKTKSQERNTAIVEAQTRAELNLAQAYMTSSAAAAVAEARKQAMIEGAKNGIDIDTRASQILAKLVGDAAVTGGKAVDQMRGEIDARAGVNKSLADGSLAYGDLESQMQLELMLRPLITARIIDAGKNYGQLTDIINELTKAHGDLSDAEKKTAMLSAVAAQQDQLDILKQQFAIIGLNESQQAIIVAQLREAVDLRKQGVDLESDLAKKRIQNAGAIEQENQALQRQKDAIKGVQDVTSQTIDDITGLLTGSKLKDVETSILGNFAKEIATLGVANPAKNAMLGQNNPTMGDVGGIGGFFKTLLGAGAPDGSQQNPYYVLPASQVAGMIGGANPLNLTDPKALLSAAATSIENGGQKAATAIGKTLDENGGSLADKLGSALEDGANWLIKGIGSLFGGGSGGGFFSDVGGLLASVFHEGTPSVGDTAAPMRFIPASAVARAPRFHNGLNSDEFLSVLQRGEGVISRADMRKARQPSAMAPLPMQITVKVDGARGSKEIADAAEAGAQRAIRASAQMLTQYDRQLDRRIVPTIRRSAQDPRWRP
ncbi:MAG TPA: phage tail length tape measure family protein [Rhizomicrobium sp.]